MFGHRRLHAGRVREIVEVAAILLAGLWALYVFVYENRIKPALAPPTLSIDVQMRHVGNDGNLAVVRIDETIRNPGTTAVFFLGHAITVLGSNAIALKSSQPATADSTSNELQAYYRYTTPEPIFRDAFVTQQGDPKTGLVEFVTPDGVSVDRLSASLAELDLRAQ